MSLKSVHKFNKNSTFIKKYVNKSMVSGEC